MTLKDSKLKKNRNSIVAIFSKGIVMLHFAKKVGKYPDISKYVAKLLQAKKMNEKHYKHTLTIRRSP